MYRPCLGEFFFHGFSFGHLYLTYTFFVFFGFMSVHSKIILNVYEVSNG